MSNKINAKLLAEAIALIITAVGGVSDVPDADDAGDEETTTKKRGRPAGTTKKAAAEKAPAKKSAGKKADPLDDDDEDEEEEEDEDDGLGLDEEDEEVTQEDMVAAFKALKASHGIDKCKEVLTKLGENNALNIAPKRYAEAMKEIQRAASKKK